MGLTTLGHRRSARCDHPSRVLGHGWSQLRGGARTGIRRRTFFEGSRGSRSRTGGVRRPLLGSLRADRVPVSGLGGSRRREADLNATSSPDSEITGEGGVFNGDDGDAASQAAQRQDAGDMALQAAIQDDGTGLSVLVVVALALLIAGLGLFALRWSARRLGDGCHSRRSLARGYTWSLSPRSFSARRGRPSRRDPEACRWNA